MLVSGIVLICVFILTLVFGIIRIINTAPLRVVEVTTLANAFVNGDGYSDSPKPRKTAKTNSYAIIEDVVQLIIELISILFAVLGTFVLYRYVKSKYTAVPTAEQKASS